MNKFASRISTSYRYLSLVLIVVIFSLSISCLVSKNTDALWGDKVLPNGLGGVNDVAGFISAVESQSGAGANAIINQLGGAGAWKQNLARVTSVSSVSSYTITATTVMQNGVAVYGNLDYAQSIDALIFYINGSVYFVIDKACGNFTTQPVLVPIKWDLTANTTVDKTTVTVGTEITWSHTLRNKGPDPTHLSVNSKYAGEVAPNGGDEITPPGIPKDGLLRQFQTVWTPTEPGEVCETILYTPANSGGTDHWHGNRSCVMVTQLGSYSISATTTVSQQTAIPGNTVSWKHALRNNGPNKTTEAIQSYIKPTGFTTSVNTYDSTIAKGVDKGSLRTLSSDSYVIKDTDVGRTFCQSIAYKAIGGSINGTSAPACVTVKALDLSKDPCRPIQIIVPPATQYGEVTHTDPKGRTYRTAPVKINTKVVIDGSTVWTNDKLQSVVKDKLYSDNILTNRYTDGNNHNVQYLEVSSHVSHYLDHYDTVLDYGWINDYSWVPGSWSGTPPKYSPGYSYISGKHWGVVGSHQVYNGSTTAESASPASKGSTNIGPCYDYKLDADINEFGNKVESGTNIVIRPTVNNTPWTQLNLSSFYSYYGTHSKSHSSHWQISYLTLAPKTGTPAYQPKAQNGTSPCAYFDPANSYGCTSTLSGYTLNGDMVFGKGPNTPNTVNFTVPDVLAGTKYCFAFSVNDPLNLDPVPLWSHAEFRYETNCIIVVKKPKAQIWGGDLFVGRSLPSASASSTSMVQTSTSVKSGTTYGSWVEYAILAPGKIEGTASGSAYKGALTGVCSYSKLSFTNAGSGNSCNTGTIKGNYAIKSSIPDVSASFATSNPVRYVGGYVNLDAIVDSGAYQSSATTINITGGTIPVNKWIVINAPNADVKISGDIKYGSGVIKKIGEVPQLVIIARSITIENNVAEINSWLVSKSFVNTCTQGGTDIKLTVSDCDKLLTINGPIMASQLYLRRTAGAGIGTKTGDPAEIMNLRSDAYLWAYARSKDNGGSARIVYSSEAPVRF